MSVPLKKNTAGQQRFVFVFDGSDIKTTPTIVAGDFQVSIDGGAFGNLTTLPTESPAASGQVEVQFSQPETNGDTIAMRWIDQAGADWDNGAATWETDTSTFADLATTLAAIVASIAALPAAMWSYATRTLTQGAASIIDTVTGEDVTTYRGTFWDVTLTGLPTLVDRADVYLAIKINKDDSDDDAIVLWSLAVGLVRLNGAAATAGDGALTVPVDTSVRVTLKATVAATLDVQIGYYYGIKRIALSDGEAYSTSEGGLWTVAADTPRAVT